MSLEIPMRNQKSRTPKPEIPLRNEKSRALNVQIILMIEIKNSKTSSFINMLMFSLLRNNQDCECK